MVFIPLKSLDYRWAAPKFDRKKQDRLLNRFATQEKILVEGKFLTSKSSIESRMFEVYKSFIAVGMKNPLAVKQESYGNEFDKENGKYFVVVGNQRLCCLRALAQQKTAEEFVRIALGKWMKEGELKNEIRENNFDIRIACRVAKDTDSWNDNTEPVKAFPYENIEGYPHNRR